MNASGICSMIDSDLVHFIHSIVVLIKIAVPVVLVIFGMLDFMKGVIASKEDEIKKGQQIFIKRLIAGAIVFFVITIVQLVMSFVSNDDNSIWACANQILNGISTYTEPDNNSKGVTDNGGTGNGSSSNISCKSDNDYLEYSNCLNSQLERTCATIFQDVCSVNGVNPIWKTISNYSESGVVCTGSNNQYSEMLKKQFYSCVAYMETTPGGQAVGPVSYCLSTYFSNYCSN